VQALRCPVMGLITGIILPNSVHFILAIEPTGRGLGLTLKGGMMPLAKGLPLGRGIKIVSIRLKRRLRQQRQALPPMLPGKMLH